MGMFMKDVIPPSEMRLPPSAPPVNMSEPHSAQQAPPMPLFNPNYHRLNLLGPTEFSFPIKNLSPIDVASRLFVSSAPEVLCEGAARLLFINVKWAKNLPTYGSLSLSDRLLLLEETWSDLFVLGSAQFLYPLNLKYLIERSGVEINRAEAQEFESVVRDIAELRLDNNEYACLRAIALFKTNFTLKPERGSLINIGGHYKRLQDLPAIAELQDQTLRILTEVSSSTNFKRPPLIGYA